jgi:hypothetical protein
VLAPEANSRPPACFARIRSAPATRQERKKHETKKKAAQLAAQASHTEKKQALGTEKKQHSPPARSEPRDGEEKRATRQREKNKCSPAIEKMVVSRVEIKTSKVRTNIGNRSHARSEATRRRGKNKCSPAIEKKVVSRVEIRTSNGSHKYRQPVAR